MDSKQSQPVKFNYEIINRVYFTSLMYIFDRGQLLLLLPFLLFNCFQQKVYFFFEKNHPVVKQRGYEDINCFRLAKPPVPPVYHNTCNRSVNLAVCQVAISLQRNSKVAK